MPPVSAGPCELGCRLALCIVSSPNGGGCPKPRARRSVLHLPPPPAGKLSKYGAEDDLESGSGAGSDLPSTPEKGKAKGSASDGDSAAVAEGAAAAPTAPAGLPPPPAVAAEEGAAAKV